MTRDELVAEIRAAIEEAVPGVSASGLGGGEDIRAALDIDSFDVLQVAIRLKDRFGVEVPESEMARILTLDSCAAYLAPRLAGTAT